MISQYFTATDCAPFALHTAMTKSRERTSSERVKTVGSEAEQKAAAPMTLLSPNLKMMLF